MLFDGTVRHMAIPSRATLVMVAWLASVLAGACGDDDDGHVPDGGGQAGTGSSDAGDAGMRCDERGCWITLEKFQSASLNCPDTLAAAQEEWRPEPGKECVTAFFRCGGFDGAAYQYGFTGDNVQCYYEGGELVGGLRTSDHGPSTLAGDLPAKSCYGGPDCDEEMDGGME